MRILCDLNTPGHLRLFDSTLDQLGARGHDVFLTFTQPDEYPGALERLGELGHPPTHLGQGPRREDEFTSMARGLRGAVDYVRYLDPRFAAADFLRARARERALRYGPFSRPFAAIRRLRPWQVRLLVRALMAAERALPTSSRVDDFIRSVGPDLVVVSPFLTAGSSQTERGNPLGRSGRRGAGRAAVGELQAQEGSDRCSAHRRCRAGATATRSGA